MFGMRACEVKMRDNVGRQVMFTDEDGEVRGGSLIMVTRYMSTGRIRFAYSPHEGAVLQSGLLDRNASVVLS